MNQEKIQAEINEISQRVNDLEEAKKRFIKLINDTENFEDLGFVCNSIGERYY